MKPLYIKQSDDQSTKLDEALTESSMGLSAFVRAAIREKCEQLGIEYPPDVGRGKYDRSKIDWKKLNE